MSRLLDKTPTGSSCRSGEQPLGCTGALQSMDILGKVSITGEVQVHTFVVVVEVQETRHKLLGDLLRSNSSLQYGLELLLAFYVSKPRQLGRRHLGNACGGGLVSGAAPCGK